MQSSKMMTCIVMCISTSAKFKLFGCRLSTVCAQNVVMTMKTHMRKSIGV